MSDPYTWNLTDAQQLAVITAMTRDDQTDNRERIAYDGPDEPCIAAADLEDMADQEADREQRWREMDSRRWAG